MIERPRMNTLSVSAFLLPTPMKAILNLIIPRSKLRGLFYDCRIARPYPLRAFTSIVIRTLRSKIRILHEVFFTYSVYNSLVGN